MSARMRAMFAIAVTVCVAACSHRQPQPAATPFIFDPKTAARVTPEPSPGTPVIAKGTYALADAGTLKAPVLSREQIAWARRVASSRVYRKRIGRLRFLPMANLETPLTIYDSCGGGWGELKDCSLPPGQVRWNDTFHIIGAGCNYLLMVAGMYGGPAPQIFVGRAPICDVLPANVSDRENLDEPFDAEYLERHGFSRHQAARLLTH